MPAPNAEVLEVELTVYTEALVVHGRVSLPARPLAETLGTLPDGILELDEATVEEHVSRARPITAPVVQLRTDAILLVLSQPPLPVDGGGEAPTVLLASPPFDVAGRLPVMSADAPLREALRTLPRRGFLSVRDATYWSDALGEARRRAPVLAINAALIEAALPYREVDPWAGLDQARGWDSGAPAGERLLASEGEAAGDGG